MHYKSCLAFTNSELRNLYCILSLTIHGAVKTDTITEGSSAGRFLFLREGNWTVSLPTIFSRLHVVTFHHSENKKYQSINSSHNQVIWTPTCQAYLAWKGYPYYLTKNSCPLACGYKHMDCGICVQSVTNGHTLKGLLFLVIVWSFLKAQCYLKSFIKGQ